MRKVFILVVGGAVSFVGASFLFAWIFTHPPKRPVAHVPSDFAHPLNTVHFNTADSLQLEGWFLSAADSAPGIIMLHGYSGNRRGVLKRAGMFYEAGFSVLLYDARGCGESEGDYTSIGLHEVEDLLAAIKWMAEQGIRDISLLGVSQGGATIALAAGRLPPIRCAVLGIDLPEFGGRS